uniref:Uncharacterized protein n=1 Tax=Zea mays TaxID=4577 RepID=B4FI51_MAIZE|nr:unknown [Zea mays]|eukprot:NP_001132798.1 uncharacterized protein LOC100194287 [Zea mays]
MPRGRRTSSARARSPSPARSARRPSTRSSVTSCATVEDPPTRLWRRPTGPTAADARGDHAGGVPRPRRRGEGGHDGGGARTTSAGLPTTSSATANAVSTWQCVCSLSASAPIREWVCVGGSQSAAGRCS